MTTHHPKVFFFKNICINFNHASISSGKASFSSHEPCVNKEKLSLVKEYKEVSVGGKG